MKTRLLLLLILFCLSAHSQTPINNYFWADHANYTVLSSSTPIDQSAAGGGLVWNFNNLSAIGTSRDSISDAVPEDYSPSGYPIPLKTATTTIKIDGNSPRIARTTYSNLADGLTLRSLYTTVPSNGSYNPIIVYFRDGFTINSFEEYQFDSPIIGTFPLDYNDTVISTIVPENPDGTGTGSWVFGTPGSNQSLFFVSTITTSVDAYGTLNLNDVGFGPYTGAVTRIKTVHHYNLKQGFMGVTGSLNITICAYYDDSVTEAPIFRTTETTIEFGASETYLTDILMERFINADNPETPVGDFFGPGAADFEVYTADTAIDQSPSGEDAVWNFSNLTSAGSSSESQATPTPTELASYPNTSKVVTTSSVVNGVNSTSKIYSGTPENAFTITAAENNGLVLNYNTNNATLGAFPLSYGYTNSDNIAGNYTYGTYSGTFTGAITTTVDAFGTLFLNGSGIDTYSTSVTRLKTVQNILLYYGPLEVGTVTVTTYGYYSNAGQAPVFRTSTTAVDVPLLSINQTNTIMEKFQINLSVAHNGLDKNVQILNPVDNFLYLKLPENVKLQSLTIADLNGRRILTGNPSGGAIDVSSLHKGMYLVSVATDAGIVVKKILKK
ncbi:MAG: T9SS type A sorting domain-containing protein [Flavobacterium sp.]|nr:T9SS type A sorting domain-containing protein [Flavobacterium sp.]